MISLSIIIPTLNEATHLPATLARVSEVWPRAEVVVVDGHSEDTTRDLARRAGARVVLSERGRGRQLRHGAERASGEWRLFLHADTLVPRVAAAVVQGFVRATPGRVATFRLRFDSGNWFLAACAWFTRFDTVWTRFGDQGILVHRDHYDALGGMPDWPLFEDVEFLRRARVTAPVVSLPATVTTSARRFRRRGCVRQQLFNAILLRKFLRGDSPQALAAFYSEESLAVPSHEHEKNSP